MDQAKSARIARDSKPTGVVANGEVTIQGKNKVEAKPEEPAKKEVYTLTVSKGATEAGSIVVTINEKDTDVLITKDMTAAEVASEIAKNVTVDGYTLETDEAKVIFKATEVGPKTSPLSIKVDEKDKENPIGVVAKGEVTTKGANKVEAKPEEPAEKEVYTLTVSKGATESGTIVVTVDSKSTEVVVTKGMTAEVVASEIAKNITADGYNITVEEDVKVVFTATEAEEKDDLVITVTDKK